MQEPNLFEKIAQEIEHLKAAVHHIILEENNRRGDDTSTYVEQGALQCHLVHEEEDYSVVPCSQTSYTTSSGFDEDIQESQSLSSEV